MKTFYVSHCSNLGKIKVIVEYSPTNLDSIILEKLNNG